MVRNFTGGIDGARFHSCSLRTVKQLVLKNKNRIVVANGCFQYSLSVVSIRNRYHFQPRDTGKIALHVLRVLGSAARGADGSAHHERHLATATGHVTHFSRIVDDLITGEEKKIAILHIDDGFHAHHGCADANSKKAQLSDWCVNHPVGKPFFEAESNRKGAAPATRHCDIFTEAKNVLISFHFFGDGISQSFSN